MSRRNPVVSYSVIALLSPQAVGFKNRSILMLTQAGDVVTKTRVDDAAL